MAEFNFPGAPAIGAEYTSGGITYTWDGEAWIVNRVLVKPYPLPRIQIKRTETDNNPPNGLVLPGELAVEMGAPLRLWVGVPLSLDPAGMKLLLDTSGGAYVLKTGDTMTGALVLPGDPVAALEAATKAYVDAMASAAANVVTPTNYVMNSAFQVNQENPGATGVASGYYPADGWVWSTTTGSYQFTQVLKPTVNGSLYRARATVVAAPGAIGVNDNLTLSQPFEGHRVSDLRAGSADARTVTIRYGVNAPAGNYSVGIRNGASNRSRVSPVTILAGEANTDVFKLLTIPLDQTGTWPADHTRSMILDFNIYAGANFQTAPNVWTAGNFLGATGTGVNIPNSGVFELFDVGMYEGTTAPKYVPPKYYNELQACRRHYVIAEGGTQIISPAAAGNWGTTTNYSVPMRAAPTVAFFQLVTSANLASNPVVGTIRAEGFLHWGAALAAGGFQYFATFKCNARV